MKKEEQQTLQKATDQLHKACQDFINALLEPFRPTMEMLLDLTKEE